MEKIQKLNTTDWKPYLNDRLIQKKHGYHIIILKDVFDDIIPLECNVCDSLYRTKDDEISHLKFDCCFKCAIRWAHPNVEAWHRGFRPSKEEILSEICERQKLFITTL